MKGMELKRVMEKAVQTVGVRGREEDKTEGRDEDDPTSFWEANMAPL